MSKVLVVDDDPDVLETLRTILTDKGFKIETVSDHEEIFNNIVSFNPNVILLDVNLRGYDGRNICKGLKNHYKTKEIPIILFSGDDTYQKDVKDCMAEDFLPKPLEVNKLVHKISDYCFNKSTVQKMTG